MKKLIISGLLIISLFILSSCGGITLSKFNKLQQGMTKSQVENVLGKKGKLSMSDSSGKEMYTYSSGFSTVYCDFYNNRLIGASQHGLN